MMFLVPVIPNYRANSIEVTGKKGVNDEGEKQEREHNFIRETKRNKNDGK